jgi:Fe-S-cluster containining protein
MTKTLCDRCSALCCRYFALPIDNPTGPKDYDNIRWYLMHENVVIFIEKKQWYIGFMSRCKNLLPDNRCGIYETRPRICREYTTDNCDYHGGEYEFERLFTSVESLTTYAEEQLNKRTKPGRRRISIIPGSGVSARSRPARDRNPARRNGKGERKACGGALLHPARANGAPLALQTPAGVRVALPVIGNGTLRG